MIPQITNVETESDIRLTAALAKATWTEHYAALLSSEQIVYMLEKFQSEEAIKDQLTNGYSYYLIREPNGKAVGYYAVQPKKEFLFLSKIYLHASARGKGFASAVVRRIKETAKELGLPAVRLTVNKGNVSSIAVYEHLGFVKIEDMVTDIGNGFVMDDYLMELTLKNISSQKKHINQI